jgi:ATP-dependent DNA helicase PIF1
MNKLNSEEITYTSRVVKSDEIINISENAINFEINQLYKRMNTDKKITLKEGAHVMCIVNLDMCSTNQIVNGSQGKVIGFVNDIPLVKFKNGVTKLMEYHSWKSEEIVGLAVQQIPLILSWAITIHKSQGITLDEAVIDIGSGIFEKGQSYVALSRVKSLDGIYLINFDHNKIMTNTKVKEYYSSIINEQAKEK